MKNINNFIESIMWEPMKKANAGINQCVLELTPCLGIGFHNLDTDESYMLHYLDLKNMNPNYEKEIEQIKEDFLDSNVNIYCTGGALYNYTTLINESLLKDRSIIEKLLQKHFPKGNIFINWNDEGGSVNLILDKKEKGFYIEKD